MTGLRKITLGNISGEKMHENVLEHLPRAIEEIVHTNENAVKWGAVLQQKHRLKELRCVAKILTDELPLRNLRKLEMRFPLSDKQRVHSREESVMSSFIVNTEIETMKQ